MCGFFFVIAVHRQGLQFSFHLHFMQMEKTKCFIVNYLSFLSGSFFAILNRAESAV